MFGQIFGAIGSFIGGSFGGGILSTIGRFVGRNIGDYLDHLNYEDEEEYLRFKNIKDGFSLNLVNYGDNIPLTFGSTRVTGKIIWVDKINFLETQEEKNIVRYEYYLSFALGLCEGGNF